MITIIYKILYIYKNFKLYFKAKMCLDIREKLPVFGSTYKEFGSHQSVLRRSKKLSRLKNHCLLGSIRERRTQGKFLNPRLERHTGKCKELWLTRTETQEWKQPQEQVPGWENMIVIDEVLETQCRQLQRTQIMGLEVDIILWNLPLLAQPGSHSKHQIKIPSGFWQGKGKKTILKSDRYSILLNKNYPVGKLVNQSLIYCGIGIIRVQLIW